VTKKKQLTVNVPAGIHDGQVLAMRGEGEPGSHGRRGDLHCLVRIKEHSFFYRQGNDLIIDLPISFTQAALGDEIEIPMLGGKKTTVEVQRGIQPGEYIRLKGMGLPDLRTKRTGDMIVRMNVEVPKRLSSEQEKILREFAKTENRNKDFMPNAHSFWEKIKQYFSGGNNEQ